MVPMHAFGYVLRNVWSVDTTSSKRCSRAEAPRVGIHAMWYPVTQNTPSV
jgi:hypothetical protein